MRRRSRRDPCLHGARPWTRQRRPVEIRPLGIWTVREEKVVAYRGYMDRAEGLREANVCL